MDSFETKTLSSGLPGLKSNKNPAIYNFPPFYTRQPTPSTWEAQAKFWETLILGDYRGRNDFLLKPELLSSDPSHPSVAIFTNKKINRKVSKELLHEVLEVMEKKGVASKTSNSKLGALEYLIWWKSREDWADEIFQWVQETGAHNRVYLVADLLDDEEFSDSAFFGIHHETMLESLKTLEKQGRVKLVSGSGGANLDAVKFGS